MTIEFVKSQVEYYRKVMNCGPSRDWDMIIGLFQHYEAILRKMESQS